jgi:hypothetical protein
VQVRDVVWGIQWHVLLSACILHPLRMRICSRGICLLQKLQTHRVRLKCYTLSYNGRSGFPTQTLGCRACLIIATPPGCPLLQSGGVFVLMINGVIIIYHLPFNSISLRSLRTATKLAKWEEPCSSRDFFSPSPPRRLGQGTSENNNFITKIYCLTTGGPSTGWWRLVRGKLQSSSLDDCTVST